MMENLAMIFIAKLIRESIRYCCQSYVSGFNKLNVIEQNTWISNLCHDFIGDFTKGYIKSNKNPDQFGVSRIIEELKNDHERREYGQTAERVQEIFNSLRVQ